jgi:hypothetical protein
MERIMVESEIGRRLDGIRAEIRGTEALVAAKRSKAARENDPIARKVLARDRYTLERELESLRAQERRIQQGIF